MRSVSWLVLFHFLFSSSPSIAAPALDPGITGLEKSAGCRIGVSVLDTENGKTFHHRASERFALCSTFKFLLAAATAARVDAGGETWEHVIIYKHEDLLEYAPVTSKPANLTAGMSVSDLCAAAMEWSDNTAANLLLPGIGGPQGLTHFLRENGDSITRLDRNEPSLNTNLPGDLRDTTTPAAFLSTMEKILVDQALQPSSREKLTRWLIGCQTGGKRIRAALPADWKVGDKTGTGENGSAGDIAILWPPGRKPIFLVIYLDGAASGNRDSLIAATTRTVLGQGIGK